jgi:hypothetical protein
VRLVDAGDPYYWWDHFIANDVLTLDDVERLKAERTRKDKMSALLKLLEEQYNSPSRTGLMKNTLQEVMNDTGFNYLIDAL